MRRPLGPGRIILAGNTLTAIALVGLVLTSSPPVFLGCYALMTLGTSLEGVAVPLGTYEIVPAEVIGAFSSARRMLLSGGAAISMPLVGYLLESVDPLCVSVPGAAMISAQGAWFRHGFRRQGELDETGRDPAAR